MKPKLHFLSQLKKKIVFQCSCYAHFVLVWLLFLLCVAFAKSQFLFHIALLTLFLLSCSSCYFYHVAFLGLPLFLHRFFLHCCIPHVVAPFTLFFSHVAAPSTQLFLVLLFSHYNFHITPLTLLLALLLHCNFCVSFLALLFSCCSFRIVSFALHLCAACVTTMRCSSRATTPFT